MVMALSCQPFLLPQSLALMAIPAGTLHLLMGQIVRPRGGAGGRGINEAPLLVIPGNQPAPLLMILREASLSPRCQGSVLCCFLKELPASVSLPFPASFLHSPFRSLLLIQHGRGAVGGWFL